MKQNLPVYLLGLFLLIAVGALGVAGLSVMSDAPPVALGPVAYLYGGGLVVLAGIVAFFIWLIRKGT